MTDYQGRNLAGENFRGHNLASANFRRANLAGANLSFANLEGTQFNGANLTGAKMVHARMNYTDLTYVDLTRASLFGASMSNINCRGANFDDTYMANTVLQGANFHLANGILDVPVSDPRGYRWLAVWSSSENGWIIVAGCRYFSVANAKIHWLRDTYHGPSAVQQTLPAALRWLESQRPILPWRK